MRGLFGKASLSVLAALMAQPVLANDAGGVDEIIVTAQKKEQNLIDVPINISVLDQDRMNRLNADDIEELADFVPGLEIQAQSLNAPSFALRGITSDGGRSRVALFQNGVAISNLRYGSSLANYDMERIEVVKGPQATLFSQGVLVGGINFIQNRASLQGFDAGARFDIGDYDMRRAEGFTNVVLGEQVAVRAAIQYKDRDGYVKNVGNSPALMGQETLAGRVAFAWAPTSSFRADLIVNAQRDDSTGTQFKSGVFVPPGGDLSPFTATGMNINADQLRDKLGNDRDVFSATAQLVWNVNNDWRITSITDTRNLQSLEAFDSDGAVFNLLQFGLQDKGKSFSQELRVNYDGGGRLSGFFGANYYREETSQLLRFSTDEARFQALFAPQIAGAARLSIAQLEGVLALRNVPGAANFDNILNPLQVSALGALQGNIVPLHGAHLEQSFTTTETTSVDIFGDLTFAVTDKLSLTGGLRYTQEDIGTTAIIRLLRGNPALGGRTNAIFFNTTLLSQQPNGVLRQRSENLDGALTYRFNAAYKWTDDLNTWAAIGRGRRPEAFAASTAQPTGFALVTEENYDHVEIGASGRFFDRRLRVTSSTYYGEYTDFQTTRFSPSAGTFITENTGNATQYGFEIEGEFTPSDNLSVFGSYAFNFSEYDDTDSNGNRLQFAGNKFRLSPENNVSFGFEWSNQIEGVGRLYLLPSYIWKDKHFFEDDNDPREFQSAYGLLDLKFGLESENGRWAASVYVENATDEKYLIDAGNTGGAFGITTYIRGVPRMAGASLEFKF